MNTHPGQDTELQRLEEAADWLIRLRDTPEDEALVADWLGWCDAAPENLDAFRRVQDTWFATGEAARAPKRSSPPAVTATTPRRRRYSRTRLAMAASLLLSIGLGALLFARPQWIYGLHTLSTPVAMHGSSTLEDGSRVELGARSRIRTDFGERERRVFIESGEAYFEVAKDASRPFIVKAGDLTVTAVGTAFNVRRGDERIVVTVSEGRVRLASDETAADAKAALEAGAGEQATFSTVERRIQVASIDPAVATAWREGVLKFKDEPLDEVVADLNRYSTREIELADPRLSELRYTGTVFGNRLEDWLHAVENVFPVQVEHRDSGKIVIRSRDEQG